MRKTIVDVIRIPTRGPGDVAGLIGLIEAGKIKPASILAILGKTEGNGGVNDFTREYAVAALSVALAPYVDLPAHDVEQRIAFVMSGGTEGVLSPHLTVFTRKAIEGGGSGTGIAGKRLSLGIAHTRDFMPEELGAAPKSMRPRPRSVSPWPTPASMIPKMCISSRSNARC
jgi:cyanuric acid amidohydrolase